jgi:hypothetical protein
LQSKQRSIAPFLSDKANVHCAFDLCLGLIRDRPIRIFYRRARVVPGVPREGRIRLFLSQISYAIGALDPGNFDFICLL